MNVRQLIERLHRFDPEMTVVVSDRISHDVSQIKIAKMKSKLGSYRTYYEYADGEEGKQVLLIS